MVYRFFKCPKCNNISTAGAWNTTTLKLCTNRISKRTYRPIQLAGRAGKWYQCPLCNQPSQIAAIIPMQTSDVCVNKIEEVIS